MSKAGPTGASRAGDYFTGHRPPLDVAFARNRDGSAESGRRRLCIACGKLHHETAPCAVSDIGEHDPSRNGPYRGTARVRTIPPGITGAELARSGRGLPTEGRAIRPGQVWQGPAARSWRVVRVRGRVVSLASIGDGRQCKSRTHWMRRSKSWQLVAEAS